MKKKNLFSFFINTEVSTRKKDKLGSYPACDLLNMALRDLFNVKTKSKNKDSAVIEIYRAIVEAKGYIYESNVPGLKALGLNPPDEIIQKEKKDG